MTLEQGLRELGVEPVTLMLVLLAALVMLLLAIAARLRRMEAVRSDEVAQALAAQHRAFLDDLHRALAHQADRFIAQGEQGAERVRLTLSRELQASAEALHKLNMGLQSQLAAQREDVGRRLAELGGSIDTAQERLRGELLEQLLTRISEHARADRELLQQGMGAAASELSMRMETLSRTVDERLQGITGHVNQRLDEGFRKTNETFANVMARLATIDEAQKKIDGLASNVVGLQELLGDKRARGAFGEVQLEALVCNMLPPDAYEFQYTLPNGTRADCVLRLPEPTGLVAVDSKFPLENYQRMLDQGMPEVDRRLAQSAFRNDVRRHVDAIAEKYIIADVTSDGAVMFLPAEAVFAEIHAYHPELVTHALAKRVWLVSPTTLMAVLNTARAVLKDVETRKQIHVIKDALAKLAKDFNRFDERMGALARHIDQANRDVQDVQVSSRKISAHFHRIESVQLDDAREGADVAPSDALRAP